MSWQYCVTATLKDQSACEAYLEWLIDGHVQAVLRWATHAEVIIHEEDIPPRVQSLYHFKDLSAYDLYIEEGASMLRQEGLLLAERLGGIEFHRSLGSRYWVSSDEG